MSSVVSRQLAHSLSSAWCNALRCLGGSVFMLLLAPFLVSVPDFGAIWPWPVILLATSVILGMGIGDTIFVESIRRIGVSRAMPIANTHPFLTAAAAIAVLGEHVSALAFAGMGLVVGGVWQVTRGSSSGGGAGAGRDLLVGAGLATMAAMAWTASSVAVRPALDVIDVPLASLIRLPLASLFMVTVVTAQVGVAPLRRLGRGHLVLIVALGATSVASSTLYLLAVSLIGVARTAAINAVAPLCAMPLAVMFLGERVTPRVLLGTLVSIVGVVLIVQG